MSDLIEELSVQADFWGVESLTENQQALLEGSITEDEYYNLEDWEV